MILNRMRTPKMTAPNRIAFIKAGFMMGCEVPFELQEYVSTIIAGGLR
jgi:hypothetical protein